MISRTGREGGVWWKCQRDMGSVNLCSRERQRGAEQHVVARFLLRGEGLLGDLLRHVVDAVDLPPIGHEDVVQCTRELATPRRLCVVRENWLGPAVLGVGRTHRLLDAGRPLAIRVDRRLRVLSLQAALRQQLVRRRVRQRVPVAHHQVRRVARVLLHVLCGQLRVDVHALHLGRAAEQARHVVARHHERLLPLLPRRQAGKDQLVLAPLRLVPRVVRLLHLPLQHEVQDLLQKPRLGLLLLLRPLGVRRRNLHDLDVLCLVPRRVPRHRHAHMVRERRPVRRKHEVVPPLRKVHVEGSRPLQGNLLQADDTSLGDRPLQLRLHAREPRRPVQVGGARVEVVVLARESRRQDVVRHDADVGAAAARGGGRRSLGGGVGTLADAEAERSRGGHRRGPYPAKHPFRRWEGGVGGWVGGGEGKERRHWQ
eukprot:Rhum_TRINITY_DN20932_c0_g1::Rhum_TRINITY_DN20932_c0_g1_i1::g.172532::m.172532